MKITNLVPLLCCLTFAGCLSRSPDLATHTDPWTGLRTDILVENQLDSGESPRERLWLNASRVFKTEGRFDYYLEVLYAAREEVGFLDIGPGLTLTVIADGREMKFDGIGGRNSQRKKMDLVFESAIYMAKADELRAIAGARQVTVKVAGKSSLVQREFNGTNFEKFKRFVDTYAPPAVK